MRAKPRTLYKILTTKYLASSISNCEKLTIGFGVQLERFSVYLDCPEHVDEASS